MGKQWGQYFVSLQARQDCMTSAGNSSAFFFSSASEEQLLAGREK
jgi:hypothetical protein